jgi:glycine cleavage system H lipoate-binding protein
MKIEMTASKDRYYTIDHEWVDFHGTIAYAGVCAFKLTGFKGIEYLELAECGFKRKGEKIAVIHYREYRIDLCMPMDGKLLKLNDLLLTGDYGLLLQYPESNGWIAQIAPSQPYERKGLLLPAEYQLNGKNKYAK